ncbi:hypothetical protein QFZ56_007888 [Streptomyces achromogenes]|uniref:Uncharacterized protein n=1 Tax=Streptomyces achromogenes TaxID=67255 RepID=A0ABU0QE43_STRAH|nr:hypothetical protein [Streptomyces achromogenes]
MRDEGTYESLLGSVAVDGLPDSFQHRASAGATDMLTFLRTAPSGAARGVYLRPDPLNPWVDAGVRRSRLCEGQRL